MPPGATITIKLRSPFRPKHIYSMLSTRKQGQYNRVTCAKPLVTKKTSLQFQLSQKWNLKPANQESPLFSNLPDEPLPSPLQKVTLQQLTLFFFWPCTASLFLLPPPIESLALYRSLERLSICFIRCGPIHQPLNKTNKIFKMYSVELCVLTCVTPPTFTPHFTSL